VAAPVIPNGQTPLLPEWKNLSNAVKGALADWGISTVNDYNKMLNDPVLSQEVYHDLHDCKELL